MLAGADIFNAHCCCNLANSRRRHFAGPSLRRGSYETSWPGGRDLRLSVRASAYRSRTTTLDLLAVASFIAAYCCCSQRPGSRFLKIFLALFTVETIVFGLADIRRTFRRVASPLAEAKIPPTLPLTVALFAIIVFAVSHIPVVRALTRIADRYFRADGCDQHRARPLRFKTLERSLATGMVVFLVVLNQAQVAITVRLNFFNRDFFNAIQEKNGPEFWRMLIWVFTPWAFIYVGSAGGRICRQLLSGHPLAALADAILYFPLAGAATPITGCR